MWFVYALTSAFLASFRKMNDKQLSHAVHHLHLAWMSKAAVLPLLGVLALATHNLLPERALPAAFWVSMLVSICITTPLDTVVYLQSLKYGQISKTAPLISLWPAVMLLSGVLFLGQKPTLMAALAVLTIVAGMYVLNAKRGEYNLLRGLWSDRGTRFGLLGVGTVSLNTTIEAVAITHSNPLLCAFWSSFGTAIVQFGYAQTIAPGRFRGAPRKIVAQNGILQGIALTLYTLAVEAGPISYVTAIRSLSATLAALLGARRFAEGLTRQKMIALGLIAAGALLLGVEA